MKTIKYLESENEKLLEALTQTTKTIEKVLGDSKSIVDMRLYQQFNKNLVLIKQIKNGK